MGKDLLISCEHPALMRMAMLKKQGFKAVFVCHTIDSWVEVLFAEDNELKVLRHVGFIPHRQGSSISLEAAREVIAEYYSQKILDSPLDYELLGARGSLLDCGVVRDEEGRGLRLDYLTRTIGRG